MIGSDEFQTLSCCTHMNEFVDPEVKDALLRMAQATIFPDARLQETNHLVRWLKTTPNVTRLQASLLCTELNGGILLLEDNKSGSLYEFTNKSTNSSENKENKDLDTFEKELLKVEETANADETIVLDDEYTTLETLLNNLTADEDNEHMQ